MTYYRGINKFSEYVTQSRFQVEAKVVLAFELQEGTKKQDPKEKELS